MKHFPKYVTETVTVIPFLTAISLSVRNWFIIGLCKCNGFYLGDNCQNVRSGVQAVNSKTNVMTPFIIGFSVGYGSIFIIGFLVIYLCFKDRIVKETSGSISESEEKSKVFMENEYHLTQNKVIDPEVNLKEIITEEVKKEEKKEEKKEGKKSSDNSYRLVSKQVDHEANLGGLIRTEEENILKKADENNNRL